MAAPAINTLELSKAMHEAGFNRDQAEAISEALNNALDISVKKDLDRLHDRIDHLQASVTKDIELLHGRMDDLEASVKKDSERLHGRMDDLEDRLHDRMDRDAISLERKILVHFYTAFIGGISLVIAAMKFLM